jgi:hypothetical protein
MSVSPVEWLCFFIVVVLSGSFLRALTHFAREGYSLAPVYDRFTEGFCDCGHADHANVARLAPAASSLGCWRRPCARNPPLALPSGSKPAATVQLLPIDVRM